MKTLSYSISDTYLIMGDGQGQNITHAQCMTDLACTVHQYTSEKYNVKVDNQKNKTKFNSKNITTDTADLILSLDLKISLNLKLCSDYLVNL